MTSSDETSYFDPENPNTEDQVEDLKISEAMIGPLHPAIINKRTGHVVSGNHRLAANPNWPVRVIDVDQLEEEKISFHANIQRKMPQAEIIKRIRTICELIEKDKGVPAEECFSYARANGYIPFNEGYARSLCPEKFKQQKRYTSPAPYERGSGDHVAKGDVQVTDTSAATNLKDAIEMAVEARDRNQSYGAILQPFLNRIAQPEAFFEAMVKGVSASTLLHLATSPANDDPSQRREGETRELLSPEVTDSAGNRYRIFLIKRGDRVTRFDGEPI